MDELALVLLLLAFSLNLWYLLWKFVHYMWQKWPERPHLTLEAVFKPSVGAIGLVGFTNLLIQEFLPHRAVSILSRLDAELVGMAITVLVIDWFNERREKRSEIVSQLTSKDQQVTSGAVEMARKLQWLQDGTLETINLSGADLTGANLREANLRKAIFIRTKLIEAQLNEADLDEADLSFANLSEANLIGTKLNQATLIGTILDRTLYSQTRTQWPQGYTPPPPPQTINIDRDQVPQ